MLIENDSSLNKSEGLLYWCPYSTENVLPLKNPSLSLLNKSERSGYFDSISNHETIYFLHPKSKSYYNIQISSAKVDGIPECYACPSS